ncbi:TetR/AcrR family transcriptional regulator [Lapillicoccus sp.]|uniref:TetR/AcrR family transcriptional regulator n=1 Tax=Lapillicoccus sp. TaxID=1909287 RepID=UPI0025D0053F|nr:TetR/AcrR family transcriptional regulator [Lapillicoccus sp.]
MSRWQPDARGRLQQAALELYADHGFEQTTVSEIAARAGLTERTFFRHFADKREVLFDGSDLLQELFVEAVQDAPAGVTPIDAVAAALYAAAAMFQRRDHSRRRRSVIDANPGLRERELTKLAALAAAVADALRRRGVSEPAASLTAEAGIAVFKVAFERWVTDDDGRDFAHFVEESLAHLRTVTTEP